MHAYPRTVAKRDAKSGSSPDDATPPPRGRKGASDARTQKPSRSGADTSRSTNLIAHGGKIDLEALRRAVHGRKLTDSSDPVAPHTSESLPSSNSSDAATPARETSEELEGRSAAAFISDDPDLQTGDTTLAQGKQTQAGSTGSEADDDAPNRVVFVLQRDLQSRLDKYLVSRISFMSRSQLQRLIDEGGVTVNGRKPKASTTLRVNDRVEVFVPPPPATDIQPEKIPLDVLFEDEHIIVLNKQPDIIVHPARSHLSGTLINALAWHFANVSGGALSKVGKEFARPGVVHRLDRDTSGLIVFAKNDEAHWRMAKQFENRTVDKRYLALVHGVFEPEIDTIDLPIGPHPSKEKGYREKQVVRHDHLGRHSLTICRVRELFPATSRTPASRNDGSRHDPARGFALVELELKTGRTHQIRVHLSHRGYPIVGDDMYGGSVALTPAMLDRSEKNTVPLVQRQALHATTLAFKHPISDAAMQFQAPFPSDLAGAVRALRALDPIHKQLTPPGATIDLGTLVPSAG